MPVGYNPWEVVYHFRWGSSKSSIQPQNEGYRLEIPTLYESTDYVEDGKVIVLQKATAGNGINVAIVGDGFADVDFTSRHFDNVMHKTMEGLFRLEPMKSFRHLFNVYAVKTVSKHNVFLEGSETALEGKYGKGEIAGTSKAECNEETLRNKYINKIPDFNPDEAICFVIFNVYTPNANTSYCRYPQDFLILFQVWVTILLQVMICTGLKMISARDSVILLVDWEQSGGLKHLKMSLPMPPKRRY